MAIDSLKLIRHLDSIEKKTPITADVFLTNYCNNKCPYCTYRRWSFEPGARYMNIDDFKKYSDRLIELGVKGIILTGGGEPTLNPDFDKITQYLESKDITYGLNTNFNTYHECSPAFLKVSLDGSSPKSYIARRGVDAYDRVIENIKAYCKFRDKDKTNVGVQIVVNKFDEIELFYESVKNLDIDFISFRPIEATNGKYSHNEIECLVPVIVNAVLNLKRKDDRVVLNTKWAQLATRFTSCLAQWAQIALNECGEVIYCCHKPYEIVGNIMDDDILKKKAEFRTDISKCDVPCRLTASNMIIEYINKEIKDGGFI